MPTQARLDVSDALYHNLVGGIGKSVNADLPCPPPFATTNAFGRQPVDMRYVGLAPPS